MGRLRKPRHQTMTGMLERIRLLVEQVAEGMGVKVPGQDEEQPPEPHPPMVHGWGKVLTRPPPPAKGRGGYPGSELAQMPPPPRTPGASVNPPTTSQPPPDEPPEAGKRTMDLLEP